MLRYTIRLAGAGALAGGAMLAYQNEAPTAHCAGDPPKVHLSMWDRVWKEGRTSWQREDVHHSLQKHIDKLLPADSIFVPLCGKTLDLGWLAQQPGVDIVVGTEAMTQAMLDLEANPGDILGFQRIPTEAADTPTTTFKEWAGAVMKPPQHAKPGVSVGRVVLLEGDHFELTKTDLPKFAASGGRSKDLMHAVWDRASLVAIRPQDRVKYVEVYKRILAPKAKILLSGFTYDQSQIDGPPWSIDPAEVNRLFPAPEWKVEKLAQFPTDVGKMKKKGIKVDEILFLVTKLT